MAEEKNLKTKLIEKLRDWLGLKKGKKGKKKSRIFHEPKPRENAPERPIYDFVLGNIGYVPKTVPSKWKKEKKKKRKKKTKQKKEKKTKKHKKKKKKKHKKRKGQIKRYIKRDDGVIQPYWVKRSGFYKHYKKVGKKGRHNVYQKITEKEKKKKEEKKTKKKTKAKKKKKESKKKAKKHKKKKKKKHKEKKPEEKKQEKAKEKVKEIEKKGAVEKKEEEKIRAREEKIKQMKGKEKEKQPKRVEREKEPVKEQPKKSSLPAPEHPLPKNRNKGQRFRGLPRQSLRRAIRRKGSGELNEARLKRVEDRMRTLMKKYNLSEQEIEKDIEKMDSHRLLEDFDRIIHLIELNKKTKQGIRETEKIETRAPKLEREKKKIKAIAKEIKKHRIITDVDKMYSYIKKNKKAIV